jgi:hypothetical protein
MIDAESDDDGYGDVRVAHPPHDADSVAPVFFVHIDDGGPSVDVLRHQFPSPLAARREATLYAAEMLRDRPDAFWTSQPWRITVTDESGGTVSVLTLEARAGSTLDS